MNPRNPNFQILVGLAVAEKLYAEKLQRVRASQTHHGCFETESLCAWQRDVNQRGYLDVELVESMYGWSVRAGSGLQNFALLAGARYGQVDGTLGDAVRWATAWCAQDPERRYAWRRAPADSYAGSPAANRAKAEGADVSFLDPAACFVEAIGSGRLSEESTSAVYAGHFMYMGTRAGRHLFKNSDTREYLP